MLPEVRRSQPIITATAEALHKNWRALTHGCADVE